MSSSCCSFLFPFIVKLLKTSVDISWLSFLISCSLSSLVSPSTTILKLPYLFIYFLKILFIYYLLYNIVLVLPYINMHLPRVYMCSPSWTPFHLPPHTIPLGHPSAPAPSFLYPASNLDWQFVSYMILYMFQCHSPISSRSLPLPQSPKDCSIHQCLFCCLVYRVIVTIFLNSIYMH